MNPTGSHRVDRHLAACSFGASVLAASLIGAAQAAPVTLTQSLDLPSVAAFGTFTTADATLANWSSLWPFTSAAQISSVTLSFTSTDRSYNDPALFPTGSGGGVPGVEIGFLLQGSSSRMAIASVNAAAPTIVVTDADAGLYDALLATLLDGTATFSLGGFVNYANANPTFSEGAVFNDGTLTVRVDGILADPTVPEPDSLALVALAVAAGVEARRRRQRHHAA